MIDLDNPVCPNCHRGNNMMLFPRESTVIVNCFHCGLEETVKETRPVPEAVDS